MNWKLIALDMDGTLLQPDLSISEENRLWIAKAREVGIEVTLATGRPQNGFVQEAVETLGFIVPYVTVNGGEVWEPRERLLKRHPLPTDDVCILRDLATEHGARFWTSSVEQIFAPDELPEDIYEYTWLKFGFFHQDRDVVEQIWGHLKQLERFEVTNSGRNNIEVNPRGVTKARGLETVCTAIGISAAEVVTIGDSVNDISMLRWAGLGIAMGNAQDVVKEAADHITADNTSHGVAQAIAMLLDERSPEA